MIDYAIVEKGGDIMEDTNNDEEREEFSWHRYIVDQFHEGLAIMNGEREFIYANRAAEQLFEVETGGLAGKYLSDFLVRQKEVHVDTDFQLKNWQEGKVELWEADILTDKRNTFTLSISISYSPKKTRKAPEGFYLLAIQDITEVKKMEDRLTYLTFHDSLTGLYNRAYLEQEMQRLETRRQLPVSMIMLDVNTLKLINDIYGHATGDKMLLLTAKALQRSCRKEDFIARWGGDEFVIFLPRTSKADAGEIYNRIVRELDHLTIEGLPVSVAIGMATNYTRGISFMEVLNEAEKNMYEHKINESSNTRHNFMLAILKKLELDGDETEEHSWRMMNLAVKIGEKIGLSEHDMDRLIHFISLHDIGMTKVPGEIRAKPGELTEEEWEIIEKHPEYGYRMALSLEFSNVAEDIYAHHENYDGTGYPRRLKRENIPQLARIGAIVDAFDVMVTGRPYKQSVSHLEALQEINRSSGKQFDPALVDIFNRVLENEGYLSHLWEMRP